MPSKITTDTTKRKAIIDSWRPNTSTPPVPLTAADALLIKANRAFGYDPDLINNTDGDPFNGLYDWLARNRWNVYPVPAANSDTANWTSDLKHVMRDEVAGIPVRRIVLEINPYTVWTGTGAYVADRTSCRPALDKSTKDLLAAAGDWTVDLSHLGNRYAVLNLNNTYTSTEAVANPGATECPLLPGAADAPIPTLVMATPSDISITRALQYLKGLGYDVGIRIDPVFLDLTGDSPDRCIIDRRVIGESGEPWASAAQFKSWMYEFRAMVTHYATVAIFAGVTPFVFLTGSELRGCTHNSSTEIREWAVSSLQLAAHEVHDILGPNCLATYAADSTEYHAFFADTGTARYFPVDQLGSDPMQEQYALEWGQPIADDDEQSPCELAEGVFRGQGTDYRYLTSDPNYSDDHHYLVDSANPSDGLGFVGDATHPGLTRHAIDPGFAIKNLPAFVEGAHYVSADDIVISDPAPPASGTLVAYVSPAAGVRIQTSAGLDLGGVTLSNLKGYDALGATVPAINTSGLDAIYPSPVGFGVRTTPWEILKYLPLNAPNDYKQGVALHGLYYKFKLPEYTRQWRVSGRDGSNVNDPVMGDYNVRNLEAESDTNKQPKFWHFRDDESNAVPNWYAAGQHRYKHSWVFECVVRIDNIPHDSEVRRYIAWGQGNDGNNEQAVRDTDPFFWIAAHKLENENYHHFEFAAFHQYQGALGPEGFAGVMVNDIEQFENPDKEKPRSQNRIVYGHVYRIQMYLNQTPRPPHNVPFAECRVWDVSDGGKLIFNQALGTPGFNTYWLMPKPNAEVFIGAGFDAPSRQTTSDLRGFLPGALYYAGMWEHDEAQWGGHFWLDDTYAGSKTIRTSWIPAMKPMAITRLGYQSLAGMQAEPDVDVSLFADDGTQPEFSRDFPDFSWWHRYRTRYDNANVYDIGGPYGAKFTADERIQALSLALTVQQFHNAQARRLDGTKMAAIAEVILDRFEAHPAPVNYAPTANGASLALPDMLKYRLSRSGNNKLWARIARANASGSNQNPPPVGAASISVTPYPSENAPSADQASALASGKGPSGSPIVQGIRYLVTDFGARGDGLQASATFNDAAFALASDTASLTGGTVYIPEGEYFLSVPYAPNSGQLIELHQGAVLNIVDGADCEVIYIGHSGITIRGGTISGNSAGQTAGTAHGIKIDAIRATIDGVHVTDCLGRGIWATGSADLCRVFDCIVDFCGEEGIQFGGSGIGSLENGTIENCIITQIGLQGNGGFGIITSGVYKVQIVGCKIYDLGTGGSLSGGIAVQGHTVLVSACIIEDVYEEGISVDGGGGTDCEDVTITGCTVRNAGAGGTTVGIGVANGAHDVTITGNLVDTAYLAGISVTKGTAVSKRIVISSNVIVNTTQYGILVSECQDVQISDNSIDTTGYQGIELTASSLIVVSGNRIRATNRDGIECSTGSYVLISSNELINCGSGATNNYRCMYLYGMTHTAVIANILFEDRAGTARATYGVEFDNGTTTSQLIANHFSTFRTDFWTLDGDTATVVLGNFTGTRTYLSTSGAPITDNTEDWGTTSLRWKKGWFVDLDFSGAFTPPSSFWGTTTEIADVVSSGGTELAGSSGKVADAGHVHKLTAGSIVNADVNASAAIAYPKLALTGSIVNADVSASAALDPVKFASKAFLVNNASDELNKTGAGTAYTVRFDNEVFDLASAFASNTFTAPETGKFHLQTVVRIADLTAAMTKGVLRIVTSNRTYAITLNIGAIRDSGNEAVLMLQAIADMDTSDTATVTLTISNGAGDTADVGGSNATWITYFSGSQVG